MTSDLRLHGRERTSQNVISKFKDVKNGSTINFIYNIEFVKLKITKKTSIKREKQTSFQLGEDICST